jgi:hypothetical protein
VDGRAQITSKLPKAPSAVIGQTPYHVLRPKFDKLCYDAQKTSTSFTNLLKMPAECGREGG